MSKGEKAVLIGTSLLIGAGLSAYGCSGGVLAVAVGLFLTWFYSLDALCAAIRKRS